MTKDEEQLIATIMHWMHVNEQARLDAALASARADAVARAEADRVRIEGLAKELRLERETCTETADLLNRESEKVRGLLDVEEERDALRAEVAALQERLRASITRGDFAQMEVAALKSQNPKQHPVKVGEWVRRLVPSPACDVGTVAKVVHVDDDTSEIEYDVKRIDGQHGVWFAKNCEPCQPATHDTEAGKAVAESAVSETVADEIKVGDVVKVVGASGDLTAQSDIGKIGEVLKIDFGDGTVRLSGAAGWVDQCDVRKVTT